MKYTEGIFIGYRGYDKLKREVQYPFGYGLSYTTFKLSDVTVSEQTDGQVNVSFRLSNTGKRDGAQVVQTYVGRAMSGKVDRAEKELKNFRKIFLKAGESKVVSFSLPREAFAYYDVISKQFEIDPGVHNVMLGFSSRDIQFTRSIEIQ